MKSVSQVTALTGISARTLQYYDEIGLLKPSELTAGGYRLYNDEALQKLIQLLSRLEKGEQCMSFKEFDLSEYINALENFKQNSSDAIVKYWGSVENFDLFVQKIKEDEPEVAKLAIKQFGSVEKYTEAMKYNLEHFSEVMEQQMSGDVKEIGEQSDALYAKLVADRTKDVSSSEVQSIVHEFDDFMHKHASADLVGKGYWNAIIDSYKSDYVKAITDTKYGSGAADYIVKAFQYYVNNSVEFDGGTINDEY